MPYEIEDKDFLELWKYFQNRADDIKEAMFKTLTWTIGFAAALLAFIFTNLVDFDPSKASVSLSAIVNVSAIAGVVICVYSSVALRESGRHIRENWKHANRCMANITNLQSIVDDNSNKRPPIPIWIQLELIVVLFALAFFAVLAWTVSAL